MTLLLLVVLSACGTGPDRPQQEQVKATDAAEVVQEDPISSIKNRFQAINEWLKSAELRMDSVDYDCPDFPSGGKIQFYRHQGELVMLKHDFFEGDHFGGSETFYLRNEKPIFVFVQEGSWRFAGPESEDPVAPNTQDDIVEYRYYYDDYVAGKEQSSLKCLKKDYVIRSWVDIPTEVDKIPNKAVECGEEAKELLKKFEDLATTETSGFDCDWEYSAF